MRPFKDITDAQWARIVPLFPELGRRGRVRGRPLTDTRAVLNGVLWVIYSDAAWASMPRRYPPYQTCHRRFTAWYSTGVLPRVLARLYGEAGEALCDAIRLRMRDKRSARRGMPPSPAFDTNLPKLTHIASLRRAA